MIPIQINNEKSLRIALTPIEYFWRQIQRVAEERNQRITFPEYLELADSKDLQEVVASVAYAHGDMRYSAYIAGFGAGNCTRERCDETFGVARYIGKYLYGTTYSEGRAECTSRPVNFLEPKPTFCTSHQKEETTTRVSPLSPVKFFNIRKGDSGGPVFVFDEEGQAIVLGITNGSDWSSSYFVNLAAYTDFFKEVLNPINKRSEKHVTYNLNAKPSFDCRSVKQPLEKLICSDLVLSDLDYKMVSSYEYIAYNWPERVTNQVRKDQRAWLQKRNACGSNIQCLEKIYRERVNELTSLIKTR